MDPRSPDALREQALVDSARTAQVEAARQLSSVRTRIADARLAEDLGRGGTRVIEPAILPEKPVRPNPRANGAIGGLLGVSAGVGLALLFDRRRARLYRRDEIAQAVGAPVLASLRTPRRYRRRTITKLLEQWLPNPHQKLGLRRAFVHLGVGAQDRPGKLLVITLAGDAAAPMLAVQLAVFSASQRIPTTLAVNGDASTSSPLHSLCKASPTGQLPVRPELSAPRGVEGTGAKRQSLRPEVAVVVESVGPGPLRLPIDDRWTTTVLAVSSGFATADLLSATALACDDEGHPIDGVFLANPDPSDATTGGLFSQLGRSSTRHRGRLGDDAGSAEALFRG